MVTQPLGRGHGGIGGPQRVVQSAVFTVGDAEIVLRLDDATVVVRLLERGDRACVRFDRAPIVPLHVGDDAEVIGAAAGGDHVVLLRRLVLRRGEELRRLVDAAAIERNGAAHVQRPHLQLPIPHHTRA